MRFVVRLGGVSLPWRFRDSDRLGEWLDHRPWTQWGQRPSVEAIRLACPTDAPLLMSAIQMAVAAADRGFANARAEMLDADAIAAGGLRTGWAHHFNIPDASSDGVLAEALRRETASRPTLWLVPPLPTVPERLLPATEQWLHLLGKLKPGIRAGVLFFDTPVAMVCDRPYEFVVGQPVTHHDLLHTDASHLWAHYVHRRIAWEAGGNLSYAQHLSQCVETEYVRPHDDHHLEKVFNEQAHRHWQQYAPASQEGLIAHLQNQRTLPPTTLPSEAFWCPHFARGRVPVPWLARALLMQQPTEYLRRALLCWPIIHELLAACFFIETHIREQLCLPAEPRENADSHSHWLNYQGQHSLTAKLQPMHAYTEPRGPWSFASFGELLDHDTTQSPDRSWWHEVREMRNHLAHGHHAGWAALLRMRQLAERVT